MMDKVEADTEHYLGMTAGVLDVISMRTSLIAAIQRVAMRNLISSESEPERKRWYFLGYNEGINLIRQQLHTEANSLF